MRAPLEVFLQDIVDREPRVVLARVPARGRRKRQRIVVQGPDGEIPELTELAQAFAADLDRLLGREASHANSWELMVERARELEGRAGALRLHFEVEELPPLMLEGYGDPAGFIYEVALRLKTPPLLTATLELEGEEVFSLATSSYYGLYASKERLEEALSPRWAELVLAARPYKRARINGEPHEDPAIHLAALALLGHDLPHLEVDVASQG